MKRPSIRSAARPAVIAVLLGSTLSLAPLQAANAVEDPSSCSEDGHVNNASVIYTLTSTKHIWTQIRGKVGGASTGAKNNFNSKILDNGTTVWQWVSGDTWGWGEQYAKNIPSIQTTRVNTEKVRMETIFDEPGPDDVCTVAWNY